MAFTKEDWWHTASDGRRIGWLWPEDFEVILESFYGERKWVNTFSAEFGFSRSTVDRWRDGTTPIPKNVAHLVSMLGTFKIKGIALPELVADWLPESTGANGRTTADAVTD